MGRKIIITVLSTFPKEYKTRSEKKQEAVQGKPITYQCDNGDTITAEWTNEAGLKYLLGRNAGYTDIICLRSKETSNEKYENELKAIIEEMNITYKDKIKYVDYLVDDDVNTISGKLTKKFEFDSSDTVYIDTTGGARTVAYYLVYLFRYFEYIGVTVKSAVYSQVNRTDDGKITGDGTIKEVRDNFRMFDLINGAHEFTSTGNPKTLANYFAGSKNENINSLLKAMEKFYDQISLCRIGDELDNALKEMEECLRAIENNPQSDNDEFRMKEMIPIIRNKFFSSRRSKYLGLTKWCVNNGLLQQALTLYVEKLPKAYFTELNFLYVDADKLEKPKNQGQDIYSDYFMNIVTGVMYGKVSITCRISKRDLRKLCFDYSYMKTVRNYVNHASEKNFKDPKEKHRKILAQENPKLYVFPDGNNFSARDINVFINQSIDFIDKVCSR